MCPAVAIVCTLSFNILIVSVFMGRMILVSLGKVAWWSLNPPFWLTEKIFLPLANHISLYVNSRVKRNSYRLALLKCNVTKDTFFLSFPAYTNMLLNVHALELEEWQPNFKTNSLVKCAA